MHTNAIASGRKTASAAIVVGKAYLTAVSVETDGTNAATIIVYDNASAASGTILFKIIVPGANSNANVVFTYPILANAGLYLSIAGTGAAANIYRL
jgi:hypothetical protein